MKCENYLGITLLNVTYKMLSSIILEPFKEFSEMILGRTNPASDHEEQRTKYL